MKFTVGCDPEFFLYDKEENANIPAPLLRSIPGTKANPHLLGSKGSVQIDGLAVEFGITPAQSEDEFVDNINTTLSNIREIIPKKYEFRFLPTTTFYREHFVKLSKEDLILGCDPEFSAYTLDVINTSRFQKDLNYYKSRTFAGHIHVGWGSNFSLKSNRHFKTCAAVAQQLDFYLGGPLDLVETYNRRRYYYGLPGAFRPKSDGLEYRYPGPEWVESEAYQRWVYKRVIKAMIDFAEGKFIVSENLPLESRESLKQYLNNPFKSNFKFGQNVKKSSLQIRSNYNIIAPIYKNHEYLIEDLPDVA